MILISFSDFIWNGMPSTLAFQYSTNWNCIVKSMQQTEEIAHEKNAKSEYSQMPMKSMTHLQRKIKCFESPLNFRITSSCLIVAYCFASEQIRIMSQNRVTFSARFLFTTSPLLNATKSRVISSAIKTKSQHDPKKNVKNGISMVNTPQPPTNCNDHAAAYPNGVFQSNGNLIENENTKIRITGVLIPLMACVVLTPLKIPNKMILDPARKCNN